eukprot:GFUD01085857.1.p1 GENE.GFUD01085857.1~~GFUD01085857.1.p1  ORF type:complete len:398 (+),score=55.59 GFUD01085857.1:115-1194(+)
MVERFSLQDTEDLSPPQFFLSEDQISSYKEEGFLIIRNILSPHLMSRLSSGSSDLTATPCLHCAMTYYDTAPLLHSYDNVCQRPELIHQHFHEVLYRSPLAHISSQLMDNRPIRILRTIILSSRARQTIPLRWHADHAIFPGQRKCGDGLVVWMPIGNTSYADANGLVVLKKSHKIHEEMIDNGTWFENQGSVHGQRLNLEFYKSLVKTHEKEEPTLNPGDAILFDRCTVHSASGVNSRNIRRNSWQIRFFADPQQFERDLYKHYPSSPITDEKNANEEGFFSGPHLPQIWPKTIPGEQHAIRQGHLLRTRQEWFLFMLGYPRHLFISNVVRSAESLGFSLQHPLFSVLVRLGEILQIV